MAGKRGKSGRGRDEERYPEVPYKRKEGVADTEEYLPGFIKKIIDALKKGQGK